MKELKYPEVIELDEFDIDVRPYITYEEKQQIILKLLEFDTYLEREYALDGILTVNMCGIPSGTDYDLLKVNGVISEIRDILKDDIDDIYKTINDMETSTHIMKNFLGEITPLLEKAVKKMPTGKKMDKMMEQALNIVTKGK